MNLLAENSDHALRAAAGGVAFVLSSPGQAASVLVGNDAELTPQDSVFAMEALFDALSIGDTGAFLRHRSA